MATKELTVGSPLKVILKFMFPIFLGNMFQQLYHFVDALIVGRYLGIKSLAAVGVTAPFIFFIISFIFASTQGFTVVTAQRFGARDYESMRKSLAISLVLSAILTVVMTIISAPFSYQFLHFLNTPSDIIQEASVYLFIMFAGIFATVFYNLSSNVLRALGDSKTPLYFLIFASFCNIIFDLLFILKFKTGIAGAGYATVLSQAIASVLCVIFMFSKFEILRLKKEDWHFDNAFVYEHLRIGIPMGIQMSVLTLGILALQYVINTFGSIAVAAATTSMRVEQLFSQCLVALGATMAVFTAQNFGAKKLSRIKDGAKCAVMINLFVCVFAIVTLAFFADNIILLFMSDPDYEVLHLAKLYLFITMAFLLFLGFLMIFRNILQGMGNVGAPLMSGFAELIARILGAFILGYYFSFTGVCFATPAAWIAATVVLFLGYKINLKKNIKIIRQKKN